MKDYGLGPLVEGKAWFNQNVQKIKKKVIMNVQLKTLSSILLFSSAHFGRTLESTLSVSDVMMAPLLNWVICLNIFVLICLNIFVKKYPNIFVKNCPNIFVKNYPNIFVKNYANIFGKNYPNIFSKFFTNIVK